MVRDGVEIAGNEYDMENLMEFMAAAANHSYSWRRQRELDTVYAAIDAALPRP